MRVSDIIDVLAPVLPKHWVRVALALIVVVTWATGWYDPLVWYVMDKARGLADQLTPVLLHAVTLPPSPTSAIRTP